ncbi:MAG: ASCH domain-containing protein [Anaeroplasma bactoclasticum]|nr:ASCH domain-containing protein [Anaeroplasma bactoclasticum]
MSNKTVKLLLYCTKAKPYLGWDDTNSRHALCNNLNQCDHDYFNGYIVAEAECDLVEEIYCELMDNGVGTDTIYYTNNDTDIEELSCLDINDLATYLPQKSGGEKVGYAIHLKNVKPFDEPKELDEYWNFQDICIGDSKVSKAPQNMCRVIDRKGILATTEDVYVLISIRPEWLCKILNGEKTIEVRTSILNLLKELIVWN